MLTRCLSPLQFTSLHGLALPTMTVQEWRNYFKSAVKPHLSHHFPSSGEAALITTSYMICSVVWGESLVKIHFGALRKTLPVKNITGIYDLQQPRVKDSIGSRPKLWPPSKPRPECRGQGKCYEAMPRSRTIFLHRPLPRCRGKTLGLGSISMLKPMP